MNLGNFQYHMPTRIVFGSGSIEKLGEEARLLGKRALIVSYADSPWVRQQYELISTLLKESGVEVIGLGEVETEPQPENIDHVASQFNSSKVDLVIGIGGGSVLDSAKGVAVVLALGGKTWDYVGRGKVTQPVLPIIAIPTTAGTGSEVTPYAIFKNKEFHRKAGIISQYIFPKVALLDPALTLSLPPRLTAVSGIDAFAHALESYTSPTRNAMSDAVARKALELIGGSLERAIEDGAYLQARENMLLGSTLGGMAIAHAGTGIAHALGATLGGFYGLEHGWLVGLALPEAIRYNTPVAQDRYAEVAQLTGHKNLGYDNEQLSALLAQQVEKWLQISGLKSTLRDLGVTRESFPAMIDDTSTQNSVGNNIQSVDREAILGFYERMF